MIKFCCLIEWYFNWFENYLYLSNFFCEIFWDSKHPSKKYSKSFPITISVYFVNLTSSTILNNLII